MRRGPWPGHFACASQVHSRWAGQIVLLVRFADGRTQFIGGGAADPQRHGLAEVFPMSETCRNKIAAADAVLRSNWLFAVLFALPSA